MGAPLKMLCVIDEFTREYLAIEVGTGLRSQDVILTLSQLMRLYGKPALVRKDNGAEFIAANVMRWMRDAAIGPAFIAPGSPGKTASLRASTASCAMRCSIVNGSAGSTLILRTLSLIPILGQRSVHVQAQALQPRVQAGDRRTGSAVEVELPPGRPGGRRNPNTLTR